MYEDRTRMEPDPKLMEPNPYYNPNGENDEKSGPKMQWRSHFEIEEWCYDQGYDSGIRPLWEYLGTDEVKDIGYKYLIEGPECAKEWVNEQVTETVDRTTDEYLETYVDGQMRLYAGYDVAENGDTLEEGEYETWEDLRIMWEMGFRDKLRGNERYTSI